ncbi:MAG: hemolysin family protein [Clostridiales bacterium]|nr:hemolysin family protein [Clostridiales bacterium]
MEDPPKMDDDPLIGLLLLQLVFIALNAIFACAEIAVISINDVKLAKLAASGDKRAIRIARLTSQPARFLATIQISITLAGFLGSAFAADNFAGKLVELLLKTGTTIPAHTLNAISVVLITLILSYFTLVFGELVPKRLAMKKAERIAFALSGIISAISTVFKPLVWLLTASTNGILRLLGINPNEEDSSVTEEEIRMMIDAGSEKGAIEADEKELLQNVFEFNDVSAADMLTHRTMVDMLWLEESDEAWAKLLSSTNHSYYPICADTADDVVGILRARDYLRLSDRTRDNVMANAVSEPLFVPESVKADDLFREMRRSRDHFAVVLDEYGGMSGIVTMNDIVEQLVGDIDGQQDDEEAIVPIDGGRYSVGGCAPLEDIAEKLGLDLPTDEFDTIGGLIFSACDTIPPDGSRFSVKVCGISADVDRIMDHRIVHAVISKAGEAASCENESKAG